MRKLTDVMPENVLDLLLLEFTTDDESTGTIHGSGCTQFSEKVLYSVLWRSVHTLANIRDVRKHCLLVPFSCNTRRRDNVSFTGVGKEGWVSGVQLAIEAS